MFGPFSVLFRCHVRKWWHSLGNLERQGPVERLEQKRRVWRDLDFLILNRRATKNNWSIIERYFFYYSETCGPGTTSVFGGVTIWVKDAVKWIVFVGDKKEKNGCQPDFNEYCALRIAYVGLRSTLVDARKAHGCDVERWARIAQASKQTPITSKQN